MIGYFYVSSAANDIITELLVNKDIENNKKKKSSTKTNSDDFIKLYNPIICTTNDINDKKINELKKFSKVVYLKKDLNNEMKILIKDIFLKNNLTISDEAIDEIIKVACDYSDYDETVTKEYWEKVKIEINKL